MSAKVAQSDWVIKNVATIVEYTARHPELQRAHHFLYDKRYCPVGSSIQYVLMGINPGETDADWAEWPRSKGVPTKETSIFDFHNGALSQSAINWRKRCLNILETEQVCLAELFFWSSHDLKELELRYGKLKGSPHLKFCAEMNLNLIKYHNPQCVIVVGLRALDLIKNTYSLVQVAPPTYDNRGRRLVEHYTDGLRPWLITKHWTGARLSKSDILQIKQCIGEASQPPLRRASK